MRKAVTKQHACKTGVPQGGNLVPFLLLVYVNDLPQVLKHFQYLFFADDLKIFRGVTTLKDTEKLMVDIGALEVWSQKNSLPLNVSKCKTITFIRRRNPICANYEIQGRLLERVNTIRDLGVIM